MKIEAISSRVVRLLILAMVAVLFLGGGVAAAKSASAAAESSSGEQEKPDALPSGSEVAVVEESSSDEESATDEEKESEKGPLRLSEQFPDREWILDEEVGKRFIIERVPKLKGAYLWEDENHVRLPGGLFHMEVVDHDDRWFWIKIYDRERRRRSTSKNTGPSEEELAAVAATYLADTETVDRLGFEPFDEGLPKQGQWRNGFDIADMNGDGQLDIVFGPARKGRAHPNIFLGDGSGRWSRWREARYPTHLPFDYGDAVAGDWNGDGHMDLALGIHMLGMVALVNDGKGGFEPWTEGIDLARPGKGVITTFSSRAVEATDWNNDGRLDLIAFGEGPKGLHLTAGRRKGSPSVNNSRGLLVYLNLGDGSWQPTQVEEVTRDFGDDFEVTDWNGDGRDDVIVASSVQNNRHILRLGQLGEEQLGLEKLEGLRPGTFITAVAASDLDAQGGEELVVAYLSHELQAWRTGIDIFSWRNGEWSRRPLIAEESRKGFHALDLGDLDGDGSQDLVALTGEGEVLVFVGDGEGFFRRELTPEMPPSVLGCKGWDVRLVDLDGDAKSEIVAAFAGERTGPEIIPEAVHPGCSKGGRINVWKAVAQDDEGEAEAASPRPAAAAMM
jgi:hypothetical protein